jgi:tetratricopeptide (TPR) repeat protein
MYIFSLSAKQMSVEYAKYGTITGNVVYRTFLSIMFVLMGILLCMMSVSAQQKRSFPIARTGKVSAQDTAAMRFAARQYFLRGMQYRLLRDYPSAIIELQLAQRYDSSAVIAYTIAHSYNQIGKRDIAQEYLINSLRKNPDYIPALELEAEFAIDDNRLLGAMTIYEHIVALQPKVKQSRYMLGRLSEFNNERKAIDIYRALMNDFGDDMQLLERMAILQKNIGDTNGYMQTAEKITAMGDINPQFIQEYIAALLDTKQYNKIIDYIKPSRAYRWGEQLPNMIAAIIEHFLLLDSITVQNTKSTIDTVLTIVQKHHFLQWEISYSAGLLRYVTGDTSAAFTLFEQSERLTNDRASLLLLQSKFLAQHDNPKKSLQLLKKGMVLFDKEYRFPLQSALVFERYSNKDSAEKYYYHAVNIEPTRAEVWTQLGIFHNRHNNYIASDSCYKRALLLSPDDPLINNNLAYSYAERGILLEQAKDNGSESSLTIADEPIIP